MPAASAARKPSKFSAASLAIATRAGWRSRSSTLGSTPTGGSPGAYLISLKQSCSDVRAQPAAADQPDLTLGPIRRANIGVSDPVQMARHIRTHLGTTRSPQALVGPRSA